MRASSATETIAAIATGTGGGIGVIRLSGPRAEAIVGQMVRPWPKGRPPSHKLHYGWVVDPRTGERLDEVLAVVMRAPRSYTGEDVAELQAHGGARSLKRLLEVALALGARTAAPGEFTRRAFEAGRIDLTRAEAVAELIAARSERALRAARALGSGALERQIGLLRSELVRALAEIEGGIDFPDERLETEPEAEIARRLSSVAAGMAKLAATYRRFTFETAEVAIVGRVNAGKSSLLNALAKEERALVDETAGTTRDLVEVEVELGGARLRLVDTAGERLDEAAGSIERRGQALARQRRERADAALLVVDGTVGFGDVERALWEALPPVPRIVVWNKRDLAGPPAGLPAGANVCETSAKTGQGLEALAQAMVALAGEEDDEGVLRVSERHHEALTDGVRALERAAATLAAGEPPELAAVDARDALHHLGRVTGETVEADVLDAIFSRFCIGK